MQTPDQALTPSPTDVWELAVNLDDQTGQVVGDSIDTLLAQGALDAWTTPIGMKKNRPGVMLSILAKPTDKDRLAALMLQLTGSFGVRMHPCTRLVLDRKHVTGQCSLGTFRIKVGSLSGKIIAAQPEMQDVKQLALANNTTLRQALNLAMAEAQKLVVGG
jgi:uncharacterized protein (DUF111 family)